MLNRFLLGIALLMGYCSLAMAWNGDRCYPQDVTGIVQEAKRNSIIVYDDYEHDNKEFFYTSHRDDIHVGDLVRVYFRCTNFRIIKMSKPTYDPHLRNLGYITKSQ